MRLLYVVSESDADAEFYALCVAKICGWTPRLISVRNRRGRGILPAKDGLRDALKAARQAAGSGAVAFLVAIDNDRAPHPENVGTLDRQRLLPGERGRESRSEWLRRELATVLGANSATWPLPVALAVPVEMLESWLVMIFRTEPLQPARFFSRADSPGAREYYHPIPPPPQWKDLCEAEQARLAERRPELAGREAFYLHAVERLDAVALSAKSESFREFVEWLAKWPRANAGVAAG